MGKKKEESVEKKKNAHFCFAFFLSFFFMYGSGDVDILEVQDLMLRRHHKDLGSVWRDKIIHHGYTYLSQTFHVQQQR